MKKIYLVRHAKSDWPDASTSDMERTLNKRGLEAAPMMGKRLQDNKVQPQLVLSSPAKRAMMTAELLLQELGLGIESIQQEPKIYNASILHLLEVVQAIDNHHDCVMLFGHNPSFTELANYLGDHHVSHLPTCSIYAMEFYVDDWRAVARGLGHCILFDYPKKGV